MSAAIPPAIIHNAREQWLMRRRELVTASDVAAILGCDPHRKPADVYASKLGLVPDEETWPMAWGTEMQNAIGRAYSRKTGRPVAMEPLDRPEVVVHPDLPWLGATPDGRVAGADARPAPADGAGAFEAKATSLGDTDDLPVHFQIQNTVQQACMGLKWGAIGAFISLRQPPRDQDVVFDPELFNLMVPRLEDFHRRVQRKEPPVDEPEWFSHEAIKRIWSANNGEEIVFDEEGVRLATDWRKWKDEEDAAKAKAEALGDLLRLKLAGAAIGRLPNGFAVALSNVKETFVAAHTKPAHTRLLFKQPKKKGRR